jgi:ribosomal 30S subunit maturation factor RimM
LCAGDHAADVHTALIPKGKPEKENVMKLKSLALCGASLALLSIGATAAIADPASGDPYTQNPTPQERAQTQGLNSQASDQAVQSVSDAQSQDDANQAQYNAQQQQYQNDKDRYDAQREHYQDQRAEYEYDRSHPATWWHDRYDTATLNHFYDIPRAELVDLRVMREDGYTVGRIREIDRHGDGRVASVRVVFRDGESAWLKSHDLRYDPDDRIVFTDLSVVELHDLARNS